MATWKWLWSKDGDSESFQGRRRWRRWRRRASSREGQPLASLELSTHPTPLLEAKKEHKKVNCLDNLKLIFHVRNGRLMWCISQVWSVNGHLWKPASLPYAWEGKTKKRESLSWVFLQAWEGKNLKPFDCDLNLVSLFNAMVYDGKINLDVSWVPKKGKIK